MNDSQNILPGNNAPEVNITVVSAGSSPDHHTSLRAILRHECWDIRNADSCADARALVRETESSVVVCERDLQDGTWKDVMSDLRAMSHPPPLVVVSPDPDDRLWAEVLNLGGYDVLLKPLDQSEVTRVVGMAWQRGRQSC